VAGRFLSGAGQRLVTRVPRFASLSLIVATVTIWGVGGQPVAAAGGGVRCLSEQKPPAPSPGEVVIAGPRQGGKEPDVVEIPAGSAWTPTGICAGAANLMNRPASIEVGAGAALLIKGERTTGVHVAVAWGAQDDKSNPDLDPGQPARMWKMTTEARALDPHDLLREFDSCRNCALTRVDFKPTDIPSILTIAYPHDLSGANLQGATLHGNFLDWNFSRADLTDAKLSDGYYTDSTFFDTTVDRTDFDGAALFGTKITALRFRSPPHFANVRTGGAGGRSCPVFKDTDFSRTGLSLQSPLLTAAGLSTCKDTPFLPGSTAPLSLIAQEAHLIRYGFPGIPNPPLDFDGATFVATAGDRADLAGLDLTGHRFNRAKFIGFPASFVKTNFSGDQLRDTNFDFAELSGAKFNDANLAGSSFRGADLSELNDEVHGATFAGEHTDLKKADFIHADISGASFEDADLSGAAFSHALAEDTDFNSVVAPHASFTGTHIYGDGQAFESANDLQGADFNGAILAGNVKQNGGFNFTHADLKGATFDGAQCIGCNFTDSTLDDVHFIGAYLPGADFAGVKSIGAAQLHEAWLYCGDRANTKCKSAGGSEKQWQWELNLGSGEDFGPIPFVQTNLGAVPFSEVATCPDGNRPSRTAGCEGKLLPAEEHAPPIPASCSAAGAGLCPTRSSTLLNTASLKELQPSIERFEPTALAAVSPANLVTADAGNGVYAAISDGTIRLLSGREHELVAGQPGNFCNRGSRRCGDGGPAKKALLDHVTGMAVGPDGSLYLADQGNFTIRRIDPKGDIIRVAGLEGDHCGGQKFGPACGNGGPATAAALDGPYGVWVDPIGRIYIADGEHGILEVRADGKIVPVGAGDFDVRGVVGAASGDLYAAAREPGSDGAWFLLKIDLKDRKVTRVVGTGHPGYNGNRNQDGFSRGTDVQITQLRGLSIARNGDVLFGDSQNALIRAYIPRNKHVTNLAGVVSDNQPQPGFTEAGHFALETKLAEPLAVAALPNGEFVVADAGNHRIRKFGPGPR
jgi:uncharacterized protein YjbI with pentapeptide repeats